MPHAPRKELISTELDAILARFTRYLVGTRYERRRKLRALTAHNYANRLGLLCEWAGTLDPTVGQAQAYLVHLSESCITRFGKPPADSTKRQAFYAVKAWFEFRRMPLTEAEEREFLVPPTPRNVREMPLDMDSIHTLLARIPDRRRYALIRTLLATGIRRAELAALKVKHIDFEARKVWVPEIGEDGRAAAKGGNGGWVHISPVALDAIQEHLASRVEPAGDDPEAPVFESLLTRGHLTPDAITTLVTDLTQRALGKRVTPHHLRHAFASYAAAGDPATGRPPMPIKALQAQLRHKRDTTTLRYVHAVGDHAEAYARSAPTF